MNRTIIAALAAVTLAVGVAGCGSTTSAPTGNSAAASSIVAAGGKISANTATQDELVAALTAGGVTNAARWAREIEEYRPYDAADPMLGKLTKNLAKYNPGADTLAKIVAVLQP